MAGDHCVVLCTVPDGACGERIATALVEERLAACVDQVAGITSTYRWEGRVQRKAEVLLVIKSTTARFEALSARIRALHPAQVPEIVALPIAAGSASYLEWLTTSTKPA